MITLPCSGCGETVRVSDLSREDDGEMGESSPALCLVCVWPEFYHWEDIADGLV